jgi:two-component system, chemotaxis family, sensor kinase Cph1
VMTISLTMHELMTNAVKYGALSIGDGRIEISWQVTEGPDAELVVRWQEAGGPPVSKPSRLGFGSRLLERMTQSEGGSAERTFGPSGLVCVLRLPWRPA